jgi:hypothetical protein
MSDRSMSPSFEDFDRGARLVVVEAGALNVRLGYPALYRPAGAAPQALHSDALVSLVPGDQLMVLAPGRIGTRNVARGESTVLILTVGTV